MGKNVYNSDYLWLTQLKNFELEQEDGRLW